MIQRLTRRYTAVKPARANDDSTEWLTVANTTAVHEFVDDLRRYGLRVAWFNLWTLLLDRVPSTEV
jgi:hypothetical protein